MTPSASTHPYKHHRFPGEMISHAVWLYVRFCLSQRDVETLLSVRGVIVSYEVMRTWCRKFSYMYRGGSSWISSRAKAARVPRRGRGRCSPASSPLALGCPRASLGRMAGLDACQAFFTFFTARATFSCTFSATRSAFSFTSPTT